MLNDLSIYSLSFECALPEFTTVEVVAAVDISLTRLPRLRLSAASMSSCPLPRRGSCSLVSFQMLISGFLSGLKIFLLHALPDTLNDLDT